MKRAGILPGDFIIGVDGEEVGPLGVDEAAERILGEAGTDVTLSLLRVDETLELTLTRAAFELISVNSRVLECGFGYIEILTFNANTVSQFEEALSHHLDNEDVGALLFDVRSNTGGELGAIVDTLDLLLPEGMIVSLRDRNGVTEEYHSDAQHSVELPMAVLISGRTASAAELFAAALQDYEVAELVGTQTYGKGTELRIISISDGAAAILVSDRYYYTPSGKSVEGVGVLPDHVVELSDEQALNFALLSDEEDPQLQKALSLLQQELTP